ncbi:hypothetical protein WSM22_28110 [Cytophagales bacterium WSM2-2]|nr:hypothetical protein WSM22_28110 [Cytophagales bacterium WSM2-2]
MRGRKLFFGLLIFVVACDTASNIPSPSKSYFIKYFGGDGNQTAVDLIVNPDGTFYILGNSVRSAGVNQRVYLAKADAQGRLLWQRTYGDPAIKMEARDFELTSDGKLAVVANKFTTSANADILLSRFTLDGNAIDSVLLQLESLPAPKNEFANSLTELNDGGFLVTGYTDYSSDPSHQWDELHLRTDKNLRQLLTATDIWKETTGSGTTNKGVKSFQTKAGKIYVFGMTNAAAIDMNFWNFGLDANGAPSGNSDVSSEFVVNGSNEIVTSVFKSPVNGYVMSGIMTDPASQTMTMYLKKIRFDNPVFDQSDIQFSYSSATGALGKGATPFVTACVGSSGYYVLANTYNNPSGFSDMMLLKLDDTFQGSGDPVILGGDGEDMAAAVSELPDGRIVVLGTMNIGTPAEQFKIVLMKLNSSGKLTD